MIRTILGKVRQPVARPSFHTSAGRANEIDSRRESGQSFIEFAISLVFLLVLFAVMFDLGYAFFTMIALRDTVQEAAAYGAICPVQSDNTTRNETLIRERIRTAAVSPLDMRDVTNITIQFSNSSGTIITPPGTPVKGGSVIITATVNHHILVPFIGSFIGTYEYPLTVTVADTVVRSRWLTQCDY